MGLKCFSHTTNFSRGGDEQRRPERYTAESKMETDMHATLGPGEKLFTLVCKVRPVGCTTVARPLFLKRRLGPQARHLKKSCTAFGTGDGAGVGICKGTPGRSLFRNDVDLELAHNFRVELDVRDGRPGHLVLGIPGFCGAKTMSSTCLISSDNI